MFTILHKSIQRSKSGPPCETDDYYSIDDGQIWMTSIQFHKWQRAMLKIVPLGDIPMLTSQV